MRLRANLVYPAELDEGDVQAGVSENVVQETLSRAGRIVKTIFKSTSDIVQRAVSPKDRLLLKESATVEFLLAYHPYIIPLRSRSGKPHLPDDLIPMCFIRLHEQVRENAQEMLKSFSDAGIDLKVLAGSSPEEVFKTTEEMGMLLPDQTVETISTGDSLARLEPDGRREWIKSQELFADLDGFDKKGIIDSLRHEGEYVCMAGDDMSDLEALGAADVTIAMQSSALSVRSIADVILLRDSLMVLSNVLKEGQRVLNQVLDILALPDAIALYDRSYPGIQYIYRGHPVAIPTIHLDLDRDGRHPGRGDRLFYESKSDTFRSDGQPHAALRPSIRNHSRYSGAYSLQVFSHLHWGYGLCPRHASVRAGFYRIDSFHLCRTPLPFSCWRRLL